MRELGRSVFLRSLVSEYHRLYERSWRYHVRWCNWMIVPCVNQEVRTGCNE